MPVFTGGSTSTETDTSTQSTPNFTPRTPWEYQHGKPEPPPTPEDFARRQSQPVTITPIGSSGASSAPQQVVFITPVGEDNKPQLDQTRAYGFNIQTREFSDFHPDVEKAIVGINKQIITKGEDVSQFQFQFVQKQDELIISAKPSLSQVSSSNVSSANILDKTQSQNQSILQSNQPIQTYSKNDIENLKAYLQKRQDVLQVPEQIKTAGGILSPTPDGNPLVETGKGIGRGILTIPAGFAGIGLGLGVVASDIKYSSEHPKLQLLETTSEQFKKDVVDPSKWYETTVKPYVEQFKAQPIGTAAEIGTVIVLPKVGGKVASDIQVKSFVKNQPIKQAELGNIYVTEAEKPTSIIESKIITEVSGKKYESQALTKTISEVEKDFTKSFSVSKIGTDVEGKIKESVALGKGVSYEKDGYIVAVEKSKVFSKEGPLKEIKSEDYAGKFLSERRNIADKEFIKTIGETVSSKGNKGVYEGLFKVERTPKYFDEGFTPPPKEFTIPKTSTQAAKSAAETAIESFRKDVAPKPPEIIGASVGANIITSPDTSKAFFSTVGTIVPKTEEPVLSIKRRQELTSEDIASQPPLQPLPVEDINKRIDKQIRNIQEDDQQQLQQVRQVKLPKQKQFTNQMQIPEQSRAPVLNQDIFNDRVQIPRQIRIPKQDQVQRQIQTPRITTINPPFPGPRSPVERIPQNPLPGFGFNRREENRMRKQFSKFNLGYSEKLHKLATPKEVLQGSVGMPRLPRSKFPKRFRL